MHVWVLTSGGPVPSSPPPLLQALFHILPPLEPDPRPPPPQYLPLKPPVAFRVWTSPSVSVSRYREGGTPSSSHQNSASEDHLEPTVLSTQAHCQCSGKCRTKSAGWQVWGCVLTFLYCGPCLHCLLPQLLAALRPHPSSSLVACFSP